MVLLDDQISEICKNRELLDPVELLVGLTNGLDFRAPNPVGVWLTNFENDQGIGALPAQEDWEVLKQLIRRTSKFNTVSVAHSLAAQKALIEYQHPKKKQVDVSTTVSGPQEITPLTNSEIRRFKRKFNSLV